jgi:6-phosphofructokinase 1
MSSRGPLAANLAHRLATLIADHLGLKARGEKPGLLGRASTTMRSDVDWREARLCGQAAVRAALGGASGVMVTLERQGGEGYSVATGLVPLSQVAGIERRFPLDWIGDGHSVLPAFGAWAAPLVGPLDRDVWLG